MSDTDNSKKILDSTVDFGTAYYFLMRVRLLNAQKLMAAINQGKVKNGVILELAYAYIQNAATDFALSLYDFLEVFKGLKPIFEYQNGSAISKVMAFRRHVLAHKGKNWGTEESKKVLEELNKDAGSLFVNCFKAMEELTTIFKDRGIVYGPGKMRPAAQLIRGPELQALLEKIPQDGQFVPVPSEDELIKFFGRVEM